MGNSKEELVMEITANIEKVFGEELAKLYSKQISEEELKEAASKAFASISNGKYEYGKYVESPLEKVINKLLLQRISDIVEMLLKKEENMAGLRDEAELIIAEARKVAHEKLVEKLANGFCSSALYSSDSQFISSSIQQAIMRLSNR